MNMGGKQYSTVFTGNAGSDEMAQPSFRVNAVLALFTISAIVVWLPFKSLSYALPLLVTILVVLAGNSGRMAKRLFLLFAAYAILVLGWIFWGREFYIEGALFTFVTYGGGVFLIVAYNWERLKSEDVLQKMARIWCWILIVEGAIGISQATYGFMLDHSFDVANGDWVKGTIGLSLHGLTKGVNFSNDMFASNIAIGLLVIPLIKGKPRLRNSALVIGGIALVMASVMHVILFLMASVALAIFILQCGRKIRSKKVLSAVGAIGITAALAGALLSANLRLIVPFATKFIHMESPKGVMVKRTFTTIPDQYPYQPYIGLGPGQFSSTGALIATGRYFGSPLHPDDIPYIPLHLTPGQEQFFYDQWLRQVKNHYYGSTQAPYFSWLSLYLEFGGLFLALLVVAFLSWLASIRKFVKLQPQNFTLGLCAGSVVIFLALLGLQVNYWGVPQASFLGFFMLAVLLANIRSGVDAGPLVETATSNE